MNWKLQISSTQSTFVPWLNEWIPVIEDSWEEVKSGTRTGILIPWLEVSGITHLQNGILAQSFATCVTWASQLNALSLNCLVGILGAVTSPSLVAGRSKSNNRGKVSDTGAWCVGLLLSAS